MYLYFFSCFYYFFLFWFFFFFFSPRLFVDRIVFLFYSQKNLSARSVFLKKKKKCTLFYKRKKIKRATPNDRDSIKMSKAQITSYAYIYIDVIQPSSKKKIKRIKIHNPHPISYLILLSNQSI